MKKRVNQKGNYLKSNLKSNTERGKTLLLLLAVVVLLLFIVVVFLDSPTGKAFVTKKAPELAKRLNINLPTIERPEFYSKTSNAQTDEKKKEQQEWEEGVAEAKKGQQFIASCKKYLTLTMGHIYTEETVKNLCTCAGYNNFQISKCLTTPPQIKMPQPLLKETKEYNQFCKDKTNGKYCVAGEFIYEGNEIRPLQLECKGNKFAAPITPFSFCDNGYACKGTTNAEPATKCSFIDITCINKYGVSSDFPFCVDGKQVATCSEGQLYNIKVCPNSCTFGSGCK